MNMKYVYHSFMDIHGHFHDSHYKSHDGVEGSTLLWGTMKTSSNNNKCENIGLEVRKIATISVDK